MKILDRTGKQVNTLSDWETQCPPASPIHWKVGRSAMETAKAWLFAPPKEFIRLFDAGFTVEEVYPEHKSAFDNYRGNSRNHDLLVIGKKLNGEKIVVCVESKVDESFGDTLADQITKAKNGHAKNPRSMALQRITDLRIALFGNEDEIQLKLGYQLLTAVAGSIVEAQKQQVNRVYFVVQTFLTSSLQSDKHRANQRDLDFFIECLTKSKYSNIHNGNTIGPINVIGNSFISSKIDLYISKIEI